MKLKWIAIPLISSLFLVGCSEVAEKPTQEELTEEITKKLEEEVDKAVEQTIDQVKEEGKQKAENLLQEGSNKLNEWLGSTSKESLSTTSESGDVLKSDGTIEQYKMEYISNYDADTLKLRFLEGPNKGQVVKTRLLLIDATEMKDRKTGKPQPFAVEGQERAEQLLRNAKTITSTFDVGERVDKYDRALLYVFLDNKLLQTSLVEEGLASIRYVNPPNTRHLDELKEAEALAKEKGIGIWSIK